MTVLYCALDQQPSGTTGGAVHVRAVASGLAALGHEVHVATHRGQAPWPDPRVHWHDLGAPLGRPHLRLLRRNAVLRLARAIRPQVVVERYHNFGGEGVLAARALSIPAALEVNAPVVDYPASAKSRVDRALVVEPMRRWREWICRQASLFVTPTRATLPSWIAPARVLELEWGADVDRFRPGARGRVPFARSPGDVVAVFAGAFRSWHGAHLLAEALVDLAARGDRRFHGVFIGSGPELARVKQIATHGARCTFTGVLPQDAVPPALAASDVGVAPFDVAAHPPLQLGFYWSPLKVFEYMASGLPVVAPRIPRLATLVEHGREGVLYDPPSAEAAANALVSLADGAVRRELGAAARTRAVRDFSWQAHCARLGEALQALVSDAQTRDQPR